MNCTKQHLSDYQSQNRAKFSVIKILISHQSKKYKCKKLSELLMLPLKNSIGEHFGCKLDLAILQVCSYRRVALQASPSAVVPRLPSLLPSVTLGGTHWLRVSLDSIQFALVLRQSIRKKNTQGTLPYVLFGRKAISKVVCIFSISHS